MAKQRARPPRPARRLKAQAKSQAGTRKWGKKFKLDEGDIIQFHSPLSHMLGSMGTVVGYLDKNVVLVKTFGGNDDDFGPITVGMRSARLDPNYANSQNNTGYLVYVTKVIHPKNPKPKKKRPPVRFYPVTPDQLPAVLTGAHEVPSGHHVVLVDREVTDDSTTVPADGSSPPTAPVVADEAVRPEGTAGST